MAATVNLYVQVTGLVNAQNVSLPKGGAGLYAPYSITTSADIVCERQVTLPGTTAVKLIEVGAGLEVASAVFFMFIPTVAGMFTWKTSSEANNNSQYCGANLPFILPDGNAAPLKATIADRIDETKEAITEVWFYTTGAVAGKCYVLALG